jgi:hypothetical protein
VIDRRERRFEVIATLILSLAALATAWSGYQASLWDGIQASRYGEASGLRTTAAQQLTLANQYRLADLDVLQGYLGAVASGQDDLADFYRGRVRDEAQPAFEAWLALDPLNNPDAPTSPLAMPEYQLAAEQEAAALTARADAAFAEGEDANSTSDVFTMATLLFASALFFAAVSERFEFLPARSTLLVIGGVALVAGLVVSLSQPVTTG